MSLDAKTLKSLLPALHLTRDAENGGALAAIIDVVAGQIAVLEEDIAQLYDDQFIETCAEWVVPYIGDLVGYRQLHGISSAIRTPRAEVADTIRLRRGKGTATTLEQLARDVTGWQAHVVEYFQFIATTQCLNHVRRNNLAFADIRSPVLLEQRDGPFDTLAHTVDVRPGVRGQGRHNIPNIGFFFWRLRAYPLIASPSVQVDASRFLFDPLGGPLALFSKAVPKPEDALATDLSNVSQPLSRYALNAAKAKFYGAGNSFFIDGVALDMLVICNLSDAGGGAWAHLPPAGKVAVDPVLGRMAFATPPARPPNVRFHYGFSANLGGGAYDRLKSFGTLTPLIQVPARQPAVAAALGAVAGGGTVEIGDNGRYGDIPAINVATAGARIELRAADMQRPLLSLGAELLVSGVDGTEVSLNGLLIAGGQLRIAASAGNKLHRLTLRHCTLVPGITRTPAGGPAQPLAPSLVVETGTFVEIDHCILGGLRIAAGAQVTITNSIIDAMQPGGVAFAGLDGLSGGGSLSVSDSTITGKVHTSEMPLAANVIFMAAPVKDDPWRAPVWVDRLQSGHARFCYLPPGSRVPRPHRCQPAAGADASTFMPVFASLRYGDPGYCQLSQRTSRAILEGSEDGSEMGVFRQLFQRQRDINLRVRLEEYLRFGLETSFNFVT